MSGMVLGTRDKVMDQRYKNRRGLQGVDKLENNDRQSVNHLCI